MHRFSIRSCNQKLADARDVAELDKTTAILSSKMRLLTDTGVLCLRRPVRFMRALREAWRLSRRSDRSIVAHFAYFAEASFLVREMERRRVRHLHAHFGTNSAAVALLCRILGGPPYSFTVHGPEEFDRAPMLALDRKIVHAKFVAAISKFGRSQLMRLVTSDQYSKIRVVRCGLDRDLLQSATQSIPDSARLVCVGRLSEQKGHFILLDAVSQLTRRGMNVELVLVGDGELRPEIERRISDLGIGAKVKITGYVNQEQVIEEIRRARALVLPSLGEGLPVVIMEAYAVGRPVLSTFIAGIPELVIPEYNGWLVPAGSVDALVSTLNEVLNCPVATLEKMADRGRTLVRDRHDIMISAKRLQEYFEEP